MPDVLDQIAAERSAAKPSFHGDILDQIVAERNANNQEPDAGTLDFAKSIGSGIVHSPAALLSGAQKAFSGEASGFGAPDASGNFPRTNNDAESSMINLAKTMWHQLQTGDLDGLGKNLGNLAGQAILGKAAQGVPGAIEAIPESPTVAAIKTVLPSAGKVAADAVEPIVRPVRTAAQGLSDAKAAYDAQAAKNATSAAAAAQRANPRPSLADIRGITPEPNTVNEPVQPIKPAAASSRAMTPASAPPPPAAPRVPLAANIPPESPPDVEPVEPIRPPQTPWALRNAARPAPPPPAAPLTQQVTAEDLAGGAKVFKTLIPAAQEGFRATAARMNAEAQARAGSGATSAQPVPQPTPSPVATPAPATGGAPRPPAAPSPAAIASEPQSIAQAMDAMQEYYEPTGRARNGRVVPTPAELGFRIAGDPDGSATLRVAGSENEKAFNAADYYFQNRDPGALDQIRTDEEFMEQARQHGLRVGNAVPKNPYRTTLKGKTLELMKAHFRKMVEDEANGIAPRYEKQAEPEDYSDLLIRSLVRNQ